MSTSALPSPSEEVRLLVLPTGWQPGCARTRGRFRPAAQWHRSAGVHCEDTATYVGACSAGLVGALFSPGFNVTTNDSFHMLAPGVKPLTVYTGYASAPLAQHSRHQTSVEVRGQPLGGSCPHRGGPACAARFRACRAVPAPEVPPEHAAATPAGISGSASCTPSWASW